jgi:hypothetical protein
MLGLCKAISKMALAKWAEALYQTRSQPHNIHLRQHLDVSGFCVITYSVGSWNGTPVLLETDKGEQALD